MLKLQSLQVYSQLICHPHHQIAYGKLNILYLNDYIRLGFRKSPKISVKGFPQVGGRTVVISSLSDWIEGKIQMLIEKNLVFPNLLDFVIPILSGNELLKGPLNL